MKRYCILGQSNNVLAMILDILRLQHPNETVGVDIIGNISPEENDSLVHSYDTPGIIATEIFHTDWQPKAYAGYWMGAPGAAKRHIFTFFQTRYGIEKHQYLPQIHPNSVIGSSVMCGYGLHLGPLSVIAPQAQLGDFVFINRNCSVGHHTLIGNYAVLRPGCNVASNCHIGENVAIGAGATVIDKIKIGANSIIGAGSVVTRDIPEGVVAYGAPAKVIRAVG